ncbi:MAG: DUF2877 domain-containing protein [Rudaea sp.]
MRDRDSIPLVALGATALSTLRANERGRVLAVFRRSFYVAFGNDVVCIGPLELGRGPLAALYARHATFTSPGHGLDVDAEVVRAGESLAVGPRWRFDFATVDAWRPPAAPAHSLTTLRAGLQSLGAAARRRLPGGLGALLPALCAGARPLLSDSEHPLVRAATPAIGALCDWLKEALGGASSPPPAVDALIGLGAGLTPSGDDFLGGVMTALHHLGRADLARALAKPVLACAVDGTSVISGAYLRCAAAGEGFEVLFDALACVLAGGGGRLDARLDALAEVGHTSGWDCLAGSIAVCGALAHAHANDMA